MFPACTEPWAPSQYHISQMWCHTPEMLVSRIKLKIILGYFLSWGPAWATRDQASKQTEKNPSSPVANLYRPKYHSDIKSAKS